MLMLSPANCQVETWRGRLGFAAQIAAEHAAEHAPDDAVLGDQVQDAQVHKAVFHEDAHAAGPPWHL